MPVRSWPSWAIALVALALAGAAPAPVTFQIGGNGLQTSDWSVARIQTQLAGEIKPLEYFSKGAAHTFSCVPLVAVLNAAGVGTDFVMRGGGDPKVKNPQLREVVVVTGRDGYAVVFSMGEILPMVGNRAIWVAMEEDGKPLSDKDGPVRLIAPEDKMPARGVHQIASIEIVELGAAATQP